MNDPGIGPQDAAAVAAQLGRAPRAVRKVAHRCPCGLPSVVQTAPRLEDGTPFPTLYYLTCSRLNSRIGTLEAEGRMREMTDRLGNDPELAQAYRRAHEAYLAERDAIEPLGTGVSAGGMPDRVKCLHVHAATRWPPAPVSIPSETRPWPRWGSGGARAPARPRRHPRESGCGSARVGVKMRASRAGVRASRGEGARESGSQSARVGV
jgi:Uncharacterized conserved protein